MGAQLTIPQLELLFDNRAAAKKITKNIGEALDVVGKRNKPTGNNLASLVLRLAEEVDPKQEKEVPLSSIVQALQAEKKQPEVVEFLQGVDSGKYVYSERKGGYRTSLEMRATDILSKMEPGEALIFLTRCMEAVQPRGLTSTVKREITKHWGPEKAQNATKETLV